MIPNIDGIWRLYISQDDSITNIDMLGCKHHSEHIIEPGNASLNNKTINDYHKNDDDQTTNFGWIKFRMVINMSILN